MQAIDAPLSLKKAADAARADGPGAISEETLQEYSPWFREAASADMALNAKRRTRPAKEGAETFCAILSYFATAARHGISWLDALTRAASGSPRIPETGLQPGSTAPRTRAGNRNLSSYVSLIRRLASR